MFRRFVPSQGKTQRSAGARQKERERGTVSGLKTLLTQQERTVLLSSLCAGFEMAMRPEAVHAVDSFEDHDITPLDLDAKYPTGNSSAAGAVANFVNIMVGVGAIGLPFALAKVWYHNVALGPLCSSYISHRVACMLSLCL